VVVIESNVFDVVVASILVSFFERCRGGASRSRGFATVDVSLAFPAFLTSSFDPPLVFFSFDRDFSVWLVRLMW